MSEPFVGEIRMFAGNFAPKGWAFCDGQLLAVSSNDALFSLLGTIYGGDGRTTFGLPDLRGRIPIHAGSGPGLSPRRLGTKSGAETETLTASQVPSHTHTVNASNQAGTAASPAGHYPANTSSGAVTTQYDVPVRASSTLVQFNSGAVQTVGGSRSHSNMQPFLCINFIIALIGIYPSRD